MGIDVEVYVRFNVFDKFKVLWEGFTEWDGFLKVEGVGFVGLVLIMIDRVVIVGVDEMCRFELFGWELCKRVVEEL